MSASHLTSPGALLKDLLQQWKKQFPKRASGGWWALAGFALQTNVYLLRFFKQLERHVEPKLAAQMEHLSDIICPTDGRLILIQVKRTLTRPALVSAVEEAYLITDLCRRETPALLDYLRFQIACQNRVTNLSVKDLSMSEVIESKGDAASWDAMLSRFDATDPIVEEPDSYDQLRTYLWNAGIKNTGALIERCAGRLLMSFGMNDPNALYQVAHELADYFFDAERHSPWEPVGHVLSAEDIEPDPKLSEYTGVLTGQHPQFQHLTKGFFRDRPQIFQALWQTFTHWLSSIDSSEGALEEKVPVFWIGGRSGEGKSVLLLQLITEALRSGIASPLLQLKDGDDLPHLMTTAPESTHLFDRAFGRIFVVVDDVYDLHRHERDEWDANVLSECDYRTPPVAIITCGPTEQREQFAARLSGPFEMTHFDLPALSLEEVYAFISWFESRTGQERNISELTTDNPLLVQLMFELAHGERIHEFARRFKKRLSDIKLFKAARSILAMNALYMDAPLDLLTTDESRDALEYLCKEEQLHFRIISRSGAAGAENVRLAHPHLAWLLFIEWVETSPTTLAKAWTRELFRSLSILEDSPDNRIAGNLLTQLLNATRLADDVTSETSSTANRRDLIRELYRLSVIRHGGLPSPGTLPKWLELEYKISGLELVPDPAECALTFFSDDTIAFSLHGSIATWVWLISESRPLQAADRMRLSARNFFFRYPDAPGIGLTLERLRIRRWNDKAVNQLILEWLAKYYAEPQADRLLISLLAASPDDVTARKWALDWLAANGDHPQAYWLLAPLVTASPGDVTVRKWALDWLAVNGNHPRAYQLLERLVPANPGEAEVLSYATDWLAANGDHPLAYHVLAPLVAANPGEAEVISYATDWLAANGNTPQAYFVLASLLAASPGDATARKWALDWLAANGNHAHAYHVLAPLVTANPGEAEVISYATDWLAANGNTPQAYFVLASLLAASPGDATARKWALDWLAANGNHAHAYQLLAPLVAANPGETIVWRRALDWLAANGDHARAYWLLAPLIAANPDEAEVIRYTADWLIANESHPNYYWLLTVMIARTGGSQEWLNRGERYVNKLDNVHPEVVLGVLLTAGKADSKFIESAFNFLDKTMLKSPRNSVLFHLHRALVFNFSNAIGYLNGRYSEQRKKTVCASIAIGMKHSPDTISEFALFAVDLLSPVHVHCILVNVIIRHIEVDYLDEMIAQWLIDNYRRKGYGSMLAALSKNTILWDRLLSLHMLPRKIIEDLNARRSQHGVR